MKKYLLAFVLLLTIGLIPSNMAAQRHRHHGPSVTVTVQKDSTNEGIEAFSDTTSVVDEDTLDENVSSVSVSLNPDDYDDPFSWGRAMQKEVWWIVAIVLIVFVIAPLGFIGLIFFFIYKMRKQKLNIAQKAVENGQPIPQPIVKEVAVTDEEMWRKGIKHASIGLGVIIFALLVGSETLTGIGAIVVCYGAGQAYIAKKSIKKNEELKE